MHETEMMKAYLSYSLDTPRKDEIRELLLQKVFEKAPRITIGDRSIELKKQIPRALLNDLIEDKGAIVEQITRVMYRGKKNLFDIPFTKSQTVLIGGKKYIQIRILADDIFMLSENLNKIREIMAEYDIEEIACFWDQVGILDSSDLEDTNYIDTSSVVVKQKMKEWSKEEQANKQPFEEIEPTVKTEFDSEKLKAQKNLELETYRREHITHM